MYRWNAGMPRIMLAQQLASPQRELPVNKTPVHRYSVQVDMGFKICKRKLSGTAAALAFLLAATTLAFAQENPQQLVKETIYNELHANQQPNYWMYRDSDTERGKTKVSRVVETPDCWFRWVESVNGQPLSAEQQQQQQNKINKLVNDKSARQKNRADISQDGNQAEHLMEMLPNVFLYSYDGEQDGNIRLKFRPNPQFHPPSSEAKVFHHMEGFLLINAREKRLAGISGTLTQNVDFGLGILGRLYKGGTFKVRQTRLAANDWEVTTLDVHIGGRALFFHTISEQQTEVKSNFQPVPANIKLADAASLAEKGNENAMAAAAP